MLLNNEGKLQAEYEAARAELQEEVARGASIQEIRARLTKGGVESKAHEQTPEQTPSKPGSKIPDDLVQIQAYIRWEKAGKPNYPPDKQLVILKSLSCFD